MRCAVIALGLVALLLGGCASRQKTRVVLLPQSDGSPSAVIVTSKSGQQVLNTPYQGAAAQGNDRGPPRVGQQTPAEIRQKYSALFEGAPARPRQFTLYFQSGSLELVPESRITLFNAIDDALRRSGAEIQILGHTDSKGGEAYNDALSEKRARLIEAILVERGFTTARVQALGRGEHDPAVPTPNGTDEPRNRRVEILVR